MTKDEQREKWRLQAQRWRQTEKGKQSSLAAAVKYGKTEQCALARKKRRATADGRKKLHATFNRYAATDKGKAAIKRASTRRSKTKSFKDYHSQWEADKRKTDPSWQARRRAAEEKYRKSANGRATIARHKDANREWLRFVGQLKNTKNGRPQLTVDQYHSAYEAQDFQCAICQCDEWPLHVDHCHTRGHMRGLLCNQCNTGLGKFTDSPNSLRRAADYVEQRA